MMNPSTTISIGMATSRTIDSPASSRTASTVPITIVNGAAIIIVAVITMSSCTCWTSFVMRVISDGAPKWLISRAENSVTRRKDRAAYLTTEPHRHVGAATTSRRRRRPPAPTTPQHDRPDPPDRVAVADEYTVVDQAERSGAGSNQGGRRLRAWRTHDEDDGPSVAIEVGAQKADAGSWMGGDAVEEQLDDLLGRRGWIVEDRMTQGEHE